MTRTKGALALLVLALTCAFAVPAHAQTATLAQLVAAASPGQTITVPAGTNPALTITGKTWAPPVRIVGQDGATVDSVSLSAVTGLIVEKVKIPRAVTIANASSNVTVKQSTIGKGIDIRSQSHHLTFAGNTIERGGRNILIYSGSIPETQWIHDVTIQGNDLGNATGDNIQISGAYDVLITQNYIHDPVENDDHNDGIQLLGGNRVRITQNTITSHGGCCLADQGIILSPARLSGGTTDTQLDPYLKVTNTTVDYNLVHHWRGSGITVAGTTNTAIANNTSWDNYSSANTMSKIGLLVDTSLGPNVNLSVTGSILQTVVKSASSTPLPLLTGNCIGGDPQFVDHAAYKLTATSPCAQFGYTDVVAPPPPTTTTRPPTPDCAALFVPAYYKWATDGPWDQLIAAHPASVIVGITDTGPGTVRDPDYAALIARLRAGGIKPYGYVDTNYAARSAPAVKTDVSLWKSLYGVTDVFFDQAAATTANLAYYQDLNAYTHGLTPGSKVALNHGVYPPESYMTAADILVTFESGYSAYAGADPPAWTKNYPPSRFVHMILGAPSSALSSILATAQTRGVGNVYVTDDTESSGNPFDTLPSYWSSEAAQTCQGTPTTTTTAPPTTTPPTTTVPTTTSPPVPTTTTLPVPTPECSPSYSPCLPITSDVDCAGRGNGPVYIAFRVKVIGPDIYKLDGDHNGYGCEKLGA